ncbi:MAG: phosphonate C-P lyase system protein PhnL [Rhodobacteraceae bacterium]|nr:phosphonate C-P lyase system protein PhnL [Paracoccaceae bacterium]
MIALRDVGKTFTLHTQGGVSIRALEGVSLRVSPGECVALTGPSGAGKSTLMRMIWGNYRLDEGEITVAGVALHRARPREIVALRRDRMGHVSQFLRVVPRVPARDVVAEPLRALGCDIGEARDRAEAMLARLNLPRRLWDLSPTTFSGGEQQRVNIARGLVHPFPVLLLDEPTASLDGANREGVMGLIDEARRRGAAILGIFHDEGARARVCTREVALHLPRGLTA